MIREKKGNIAGHNKDILEVLNHIQFGLETDKTSISQNIDTETTARIRKFITDPKQGLVDTYFEYDKAVSEVIIHDGMTNFIRSNKNVKCAKMVRNLSGICFFINLKKDNEEARDPFYDVSYKILNSPMSSKFKVSFNFVSESTLDGIEAEELPTP